MIVSICLPWMKCSLFNRARCFVLFYKCFSLGLQLGILAVQPHIPQASWENNSRLHSEGEDFRGHQDTEKWVSADPTDVLICWLGKRSTGSAEEPRSGTQIGERSSWCASLCISSDLTNVPLQRLEKVKKMNKCCPFGDIIQWRLIQTWFLFPPSPYEWNLPNCRIWSVDSASLPHLN